MQGQKPLHYGIFLASGGIISIISAYILLFTNSPTKNSIRLFLYIGGLFMFIGLIKLAILKFKQFKNKEEKFSEHLAGIDSIEKREKEIKNKFSNNQTTKQNNVGSKSPNKIITCPRCQTLNYISSNYCHMCGTRLK